jgi:outer membrane lipopolysaccharide assembly protein LptE/RlpB
MPNLCHPAVQRHRFARCDNKANRMKLRLALSFVLSTLLTGCGYHTAGSATHIPANVRTMAVPIFSTRTQAYHTEMAFTQAVIRELNTRTRYRILNTDTTDADAILRGTILSQTITPLTYDANSSQSSSYLVSVTASVVLTAHDGNVLYRNDAVTFREQYQSTQDVNTFIQEGSPAISRMSRDFAQTVVSDMLNSF